MNQNELPGMPAPTAPKLRKGSRAWIASEMDRFKQLCSDHSGLTQPFMAAMALGVSRQRVCQLMKLGHLRSFEVMGKSFVSCADIEEFAKLERGTAFRYQLHNEVPSWIAA
jgi:hypothetical protein